MVVGFAFVMNSRLGEFEWTPAMDAYWMTGKSFGIHDVISAQPFASHGSTCVMLLSLHSQRMP